MLCALVAAAGARLPAAGSAAGDQPASPGLFDPRRPPAGEIETRVADGFTLAAVGDCISSRPLLPTLARDAPFAAAVALLRDADAAFGNFENTAIDIREFRGSPYPWSGDWALLAQPEVPRDLKALGIDLVSRANNHALDWGVEGMRETDRRLDEAGVIHAGTGEHRGAARAPRYLETGKGRVGLVSMASTFPEWAEAQPPRGQAPGRPGVNALKVRSLTVVTGDTLRVIASLKATLTAGAASCGPPGEAPASSPSPAPTPGVELFGERFAPGERPVRRYTIDPVDFEENLRAIRLGKQHSDLLIATIHAHEEGLGCDEPGDFLKELAHAAIDAGAGAFFVHGVHRLGPIEIYKGRPIFYGLGNFFWSDIQEPLPASQYEQNRDLLAAALGDPARGTDADLTALMNASAFNDEQVFQTIVSVTRYEKGRAAEILLYPVDLGYGLPLTRSGTPRLASPHAARVILERLQRLSKPYGTVIDIEKNIGTIRPR